MDRIRVIEVCTGAKKGLAEARPSMWMLTTWDISHVSVFVSKVDFTAGFE